MQKKHKKRRKKSHINVITNKVEKRKEKKNS